MELETKSDDEMEKPKTCVNCRREVALGEDLRAVEEGVMGPRGVVPLGHLLLLNRLEGMVSSEHK